QRLSRGRAFLTAVVEPVDDVRGAWDANVVRLALESFRALAAVAGAEPDELEETSGELSFEIAAQVELPAPAKQELLELSSEQRRLELVTGLLDALREAMLAAHELGEHAKKNGSRRHE
ncbi:MAG: hypothetical protein QOK22_787, partial [Gaiellaceae bacterium]|nr:hypothetical protein [Gaiellaceae bacterium]